MALSTRNTPLYDFIDEMQRVGIKQPGLFTELGLLVLCGFFAALLSRFVRPRLISTEHGESWRIGSTGVAKVLFPLIFWILVELSIRLWHGPHGVLLPVCSNLLAAWTLVRTAVYLIHEIFIQALWVRRFEKLIVAVLWLLCALRILGLQQSMEEALDQIVFPMGKQHISLLMILNGMLSIMLTLLLALWLGRLFERRVMGADALDMSLRVVMVKVARTLLVFCAIIIALPLVGIDLTVLSVFGGAVGVGLGFGLQKIASNYVSGFIILLDRSISIGDLVSIDNRQGFVKGITSRYVILKLGDGAEAIIPNETLITSTVVNLTYTDKKIRVVLMLHIAYGSDVDVVMPMLMEIAHSSERVLAEPAPQVFVRTLGDNGIELEFGVWVDRADLGTTDIRSELNVKILRAFKGAGIEIAGPRREIILRESAGRAVPGMEAA